MPAVNTNYNPFRQGGGGDGYRRPATRWDELYKGVEGSTVGSEVRFDAPVEDLPWSMKEGLPDSGSRGDGQLFAADEALQCKCADCYQYKGRYVVTSMKSGLMLVDQHRAHVRILFERYLKQLAEQGAVSQGMLFPEMLELSMSQAAVMDSLLDDFSRLGFDISNMGGGSFAVQGVPEGIAGLKPSMLVADMLAGAMEKDGMGEENVHRGMALVMARSAAIVVGEVLSAAEMEDLVDGLFACEMPGYTPDGKKTFVVIEDAELEKLFR